MKAIRKRREKLWLEDPTCKNCGVPTILPKDIEGMVKPDGVPRDVEVPDNMATIQHIYPRNHPERHRKNKNNEERRILWCYKCNKEDGKITSKRYMKDKLEFNFIRVNEKEIAKLNDSYVFFVVEKNILGHKIKFIHVGVFEKESQLFRTDGEVFRPSKVEKFAHYNPKDL